MDSVNCSGFREIPCTNSNQNIEGYLGEVLIEGTKNSLSQNICEPIDNLTQLWNCLANPPQWTKSISSIFPRSNFVVKNAINDSYYDKELFQPRIRYDSRIVPRTLVCHDMKNGYLEDKYVGSVKVTNGYTFYHWAQIDIFVYFSHHFITIPPLAWINVAHSNGVKILGTLITEWNDGSVLCNQIFQNSHTMTKFADALVDLAIMFKLDGWLLNIENPVPQKSLLKEFVRYLTETIHKKIPGSLIIWYDSVIVNGDLIWQNELNVYNRYFFDVSDGIFLNYNWNEESLIRSVKAAQHRHLDVYVGIDIFGRNTFGGGRFNAYVAAKVIRKHNLSIAIFAQGWVHESLDREPQETFLERFLNRNNAFWSCLWPYLYSHPINRFFQTNFYVGVDKTWYNLHNQEIQSTQILQPKVDELEFSKLLHNVCKCILLHFDDVDSSTSCLLERREGKPVIHHLFTCDIEVSNKIVVYVITKNSHQGSFNLVILSQDLGGRVTKHICSQSEENVHGDQAYDFRPVNRWKRDLSKVVIHPYREDEIETKAFEIEMENSRILEIGVEIEGPSICICGFGIIKSQDAEITHNQQ